MNPISSAQTILRAVYAPASPQAVGAASTAPGALADDKVSHTTRISQAGRALSRHGQGAQASSAQGSTIEALREALLERIRQLQEQLARKQQELAALAVAAAVLGGLASSRLQNVLVKQEKVAVDVGADSDAFAQVGMFTVNAIVSPGVDPALVAKRLDEIVADLAKNGPTADEVQRVLTTAVSQRISGLEKVGGFGGKAVALAEGELYSDDPGFYKKQLAALAAQTPQTVREAARKWLERPAYTLTVLPGERDRYAEAEAKAPLPVAAAATPPIKVKGTRGPIPPTGAVADLAFPRVERTRLANGIELIYANRTTVPITRGVLSFDAGTAADVADKLGTQTLTLAMIDEGTRALDSIHLAEAKERLGLDISTGSSADRTTLSFRAPSALASALRSTRLA